MIGRIFNKILSPLGREYRYGSIIPKRAPDQYHKAVHSLEEGNAILAGKLAAGAPFLAARIGLVELWIMLNYLDYRHRARVVWDETVMEPAWKLAGIFPVEDHYLRVFAETYIEAIKHVSVMGIWNNPGENEIIRRYCPNAELIPLKSLEPYFFSTPWSRMLKGKKVLVVHPFEDSIHYQYLHKREQLFSNPEVLPLFELKTVRAVQTLTYNTASYNNWIEVFEHMKAEIDKHEFDVALIGAGGYGLPLAAHVRKMGRQAVHMGGATQLLFGIRGKRWEDREEFKALFNEHWKRPYAAEQPENARLHENGAYW